MEINIEDNFSRLFDKNNNMAYKALQTLQKECEESDKVYCYMDPNLPEKIIHMSIFIVKSRG